MRTFECNPQILWFFLTFWDTDQKSNMLHKKIIFSPVATNWQDAPSKSSENFLSSGISCQSSQFIPGFSPPVYRTNRAPILMMSSKLYVNVWPWFIMYMNEYSYNLVQYLPLSDPRHLMLTVSWPLYTRHITYAYVEGLFVLATLSRLFTRQPACANSYPIIEEWGSDCKKNTYAVWMASVSLHNVGPPKVPPLNSSIRWCFDGLRGFKGPLIELPWRRDIFKPE